MRESSIAELCASRKASVVSDTGIGVGCDSEADPEDWFGSIARGLLGKDAGFALSKLTGVPEGSCYKYTTVQAASRRQPPGYLLRQILRTPQGYQFLAAFMDGCEVPWWRDLQRTRRIADAISKID